MESRDRSSRAVPESGQRPGHRPGSAGFPDRDLRALEHEVLRLATELATLGEFPRTARLAVERLRATDLLGRYGGDELLVALPETGADAALYQAKRDGRDRTVLMTPPARLVTGPTKRRQNRRLGGS